MLVPACDFFWGPIGQLKLIGKGDAFVSWGKCIGSHGSLALTL